MCSASRRALRPVFGTCPTEPFLRQQGEGADAVGVAVGDGGHDELVRLGRPRGAPRVGPPRSAANRRTACPRGHARAPAPRRSRRAGRPRRGPGTAGLPRPCEWRGPTARSRRPACCALSSSGATTTSAETATIGAIERRRGDEGGTVGVGGSQGGGRGDVVAGGETDPESPGHLRALARRCSRGPRARRRRRSPARDGGRVRRRSGRCRAGARECRTEARRTRPTPRSSAAAGRR